MDKIEELLTRGVANIIPNKQELEKTLRSGKKLNIYLGIDPTSIKIHLGHTVPLRKIQAFAELGHNVTFLIGDFTSLIGDTSDKDTERPNLTTEEIEKNFRDYKKQAEKIVDFSKVYVRHNSEWLKKLSFEDIVKLTKHFSVGDFVGRELIRKRLGENKKVGLHEFLYPVMQGYDSYFMDTDIQVGGTDQTFNMQAGRTLQKDLRKKQSFVITNVILEGTDGRKMSKSWGNAIWLDDSPDDMYRKIMAINDELIIQYFTLATNVSLEKIEEIKNSLKNDGQPMSIKKQLASQIVFELHDKEKALAAQKNFEKLVQQKEAPRDIPIIHLTDKSQSIIEFLIKSNLAPSKSEAKRLITQNAISLNEEKITDPEFKIKEGVLRVGKHKFAKIILDSI